MINKVKAFLIKDLLIEKSYKFIFLFGIFSTFFSLLIFFFIDKLYGYQINKHLEIYKTNYFSYVFISLILFNYTGAGMGSISEKIRIEKLQGTFEIIINNEKIFLPFLFSTIIFNILLASIESLIYVIGGIFILDINFSNINFLSFFFSFFLSIICFTSIGIISSCFIIIFRKGNPISFLLNSLEGFFGGVYFPITVLPLWLQSISKFIPIYYAINSVQKSIYSNASIMEIRKELIILSLFSLFLFPISIYLFKKSVYYSKIKGSINQY